MRRSNKRPKWLLFLCCLQLMVGLLCPGQKIIAAKEQDIIIHATVGFGGNSVRMSRQNTIDIRLENNTNTVFKGYVSAYMYMEDTDGNNLSRKQVELPAGVQTQIQLPIYISYNQNKMKVFLEDENKEPVASTELRMHCISSNDTVAGVYGDSPEKLEYLKEYNVDEIIKLTQDALPDSESEWECFDLVVFDCFELAEFSEETMLTLQSWIVDGGTVILGNSANSREFLEKLMQNTASSKNVLDKKDKIVKYLVHRGTILAFERRLSLAENLWGEDGEQITDLISDNYGRNMEKQCFSDYFDMGAWGVINSTKEMGKMPSMAVLFVFFAIYVGWISGGCRAVLKRMERLEHMWAWVVVSAFAFSGILYLIGKQSRVPENYMEYQDIVEYSNGESQAKVTSLINIFSASNHPFTLEIPDAMKVWEHSYYEWEEEEKQEYLGEFTNGICVEEDLMGTRSLTLEHVKVFSSSDLCAEYKVAQTGEYDSDLSCNGNLYQGTFTNRMGSTLRNAIFLAGKKMYVLGDIADGATVAISEELPHTNINCIDALHNNTKAREYAGFGEVDTQSYETYMLKGYLRIFANYIETGSATANLMEPKVLGILDKDVTREQEWGIDTNGYTLSSFLVSVDYENGDEKFYPDIVATSKDEELSTDVAYVFGDMVEVKIFFPKKEKLSGIYYYKNMNQTYKSQWKLQTAFVGKMEMYNYKEEQYEVVWDNFKSDNEWTKLSDYISSDNGIRLRFKKSKKNGKEQIMPMISATTKREVK